MKPSLTKYTLFFLAGAAPAGLVARYLIPYPSEFFITAAALACGIFALIVASFIEETP